MCRYAMMRYKQHYACFRCRKTFKRKLLIDVERDVAYDQDRPNVAAKCPECGALMAGMGLDFESPRQRDLKAWAHVENLYESGITFHSCGCSGPGYIPKDKRALVAFLQEKRVGYIDHRDFWAQRTTPQTQSEQDRDWSKNSRYLTSVSKKNRTDRIKAVRYWAEKINQLDQRIDQLTVGRNITR